MIGEWGFGLGMKPWFQWLAFALAGMVQVFAGAKFYRGAWNQLKIGNSNMDTLVALGSTTAFGYSAWRCWVAWAAISISWKPRPSSRSSASATGWKPA